MFAVSDWDMAKRSWHRPVSRAAWRSRIALRMSPWDACTISSRSSSEQECELEFSRSLIVRRWLSMISWSRGEKNKGRHREVRGGMSALWFVVENIKRQVKLERSIILRSACCASLVKVWASSKTISLNSASSGRNEAYHLMIYLKFVINDWLFS